jgi:hypothetical protein
LPAGLEGLNTLETQALDLGLLVPLMVLTGWLLWTEKPWGYFLAGITVTVALMMFVAIPAMVLAAARGGGYVRGSEVAIMGVAIVIGLIFPVLLFRSVREEMA